MAQTSGSAGGTGSYTLSNSQTVPSEMITAPLASWAYTAGSNVLYLDSATLSWMFPGLGISINNGGVGQTYIVTGVYPYLGYVTVIWAGSVSGGLLQGSGVYSCSSGCTIGQAPFAWTAY